MSQGNPSDYFVHTLLCARDWQHRPQFDQVCDWWRGRGVGFQPANRHDGKLGVYATRGCGVCAWVGMGGAGKTAIAERFLHELLDDTSAMRERISPPHSVFVCSFYDDDKAESSFANANLAGSSSVIEKEKSATQLMFDTQQQQELIMLHREEKVQESGTRGGFGQLISSRLRDLLNHIASGSSRKLSVLVTSRYPSIPTSGTTNPVSSTSTRSTSPRVSRATASPRRPRIAAFCTIQRPMASIDVRIRGTVCPRTTQR